MAPPPPLTCGTCDYATPAGIPTYGDMIRVLDIHARSAHPQGFAQAAGQGQGTGGQGKQEKLPRPSLGTGITDADWNYFESQWQRYKRSTRVTGQDAVDQLWACLNETLARAVYDSGENNDSDEEKLMASIKKLAVRAQNKLVNVTNFLGMGQDRDETVGAFTARLRGQGAVDTSRNVAAPGRTRSTS